MKSDTFFCTEMIAPLATVNWSMEYLMNTEHCHIIVVHSMEWSLDEYPLQFEFKLKTERFQWSVQLVVRKDYSEGDGLKWLHQSALHNILATIKWSLIWIHFHQTWIVIIWQNESNGWKYFKSFFMFMIMFDMMIF